MIRSAACIVLILGLAAAAFPQEPSTFTKLPVREAMVFKDGHAFLVHEGEVVADEAGRFVLDELPKPVLGTFWPFAAEKGLAVRSVVAGRRKVRMERPALELRELIEVNAGSRVQLTEIDGTRLGGKLLGVPAHEGKEAAYFWLETAEGTKAVPLARLRDVTFLSGHERRYVLEQPRTRLTVTLEGAAKPGRRARLGMAYVQKGLRWIPSYRITIDGEGEALVELQGTLVNDLTDLSDATVHLVVGVPSFAFADLVDPMSMEAMARQAARSAQPSQVFSNFSNAVATQVEGYAPAPAAETPLGDRMDGAEGVEDLYVFTLKHVTLKKGERMVAPVASFKACYEDVYTVDIPSAPPRQIIGRRGSIDRTDLERLAARPKAIHKIRLQNDGDHPLTTAPALILKGGRVAAQGTMTYTPPGAATDLSLTAAVDLKVEHEESEQGRHANEMELGGHYYHRIELSGSVELTNGTGRRAKVEVVRYALGHVASVGAGGHGESLGPADAATPTMWWQRYSWPGWWYLVNGTARISWTVELEPGATKKLDFVWYHYWR